MVGDQTRYELNPKTGESGLEPAATAADTVKVTATNANLTPVVNAGDDQNRKLEEIVMLDGSESFDPNGDKLQYQWRLVSVPQKSKLTDDGIIGSKFSTKTAKLKGANYYFFFAGMMLLAAILFIPVARVYKGKTYLQKEAENGEATGK